MPYFLPVMVLMSFSFSIPFTSLLEQPLLKSFIFRYVRLIFTGNYLAVKIGKFIHTS